MKLMHHPERGESNIIQDYRTSKPRCTFHHPVYPLVSAGWPVRQRWLFSGFPWHPPLFPGCQAKAALAHPAHFSPLLLHLRLRLRRSPLAAWLYQQPDQKVTTWKTKQLQPSGTVYVLVFSGCPLPKRCSAIHTYKSIIIWISYIKRKKYNIQLRGGVNSYPNGSQ